MVAAGGSALTEVLESLPGAWLDFPFGDETEVWKVGPRMFALRPINGGRLGSSVTLKCDPFEAQRLRQDFAGITAGYHLNKKHWITIDTTSDVPDELVADLTARSHQLVFASLTRAEKAAVEAG